MLRLPTNRPPTHPGDLLSEDFLLPNGISQAELARRINVPLQRINLLVNGRRGVTPDTALRLSRYFGTTPEFWLMGQLAWDLYHEMHETGRARDMTRIKPFAQKSSKSASTLRRSPSSPRAQRMATHGGK